MLDDIIHWLEVHEGSCSWKAVFGIPCPGCGMQTALIELLKGHLISSFKAFPALLPMIALLLFLVIHIVFKLPKGALILKILFIFTSSVMMIIYLIRVFHY